MPSDLKATTPEMSELSEDDLTALELEALNNDEISEGNGELILRIIAELRRHRSAPAQGDEAAIRADERERCAKIAFDGNGSDPADCAHNIAAAIRSATGGT